VSAVAVLLPCRNQRHLLWRSLASLAAQTRPPDQILILDRGSSDGLGDWLLACWPGTEVCTVADEAGVPDSLGIALTAETVVVLQPGHAWDRDHLRRLESEQRLLPRSALGEALTTTTAAVDPPPALADLDEALATLGTSPSALAVDLRAAARPLDLIGLLGLALRLRARSGSLRALTLAELTWPEVEAERPETPLLVVYGGMLDLDHAGEQLCIERLISSRPKAPVRLLLGGLRPTTPVMLSRLLGAAAGHPDLELWLVDPIGRRYAASLFGPHRVRPVPSLIEGLADPLRFLSTHPAIDPAMLGDPAGRYDLAARAQSHADWWSGYELGALQRLGPSLATLAGLRSAIAGPVLKRAWLTTLVGWSVACTDATAPCPADSLLSRFVSMCARQG
jgi:hypothetical protein